ncbi:TIGR01841 family phasin [Variovorax dokdonensis]|uniref:TIGR01841 family phasin n=1 Tax=Variovorax dokdonensis TaxID=344883 RepID=A0ABT7NFJ0_9BURK|nr:TIGR01841 family phasin [Variovorax dokdonensis]MDM0046723.1 TIGR01841 family phasin [Variovorax dokdonensis]
MATSRKTTTGAKPAAAKASAHGAQMEDMQKAFAQPLKEMGERLQNMNLGTAASAIAASRRKDLEAMVKANQKAYQGLQSVVARQTEMLRNSIAEWQSTVKTMPGGDAKQNIAKLDEMGRASFKRALDDIRELAEMAAKSQADAFEIVRGRIEENVEEVREMLKPGKK